MRLAGERVGAVEDRRYVRRSVAGPEPSGGVLGHVAQVALAAMLLIGGVLYVRSYLGLVRLDKGFDSSGVVAISLTMPPQLLGSGAERAAMARTTLERLRARPGVLGAFEGSPPPSTGDSPTSNDHIEVDGELGGPVIRGPATSDAPLTFSCDAISARTEFLPRHSCQASPKQRWRQCDSHVAGRSTTLCCRSTRPHLSGDLAGSAGSGSVDRS